MSPEKSGRQSTRKGSDEVGAPAPDKAPDNARDESEDLTDDDLDTAAGGATLRMQGMSTLDPAARLKPTTLRTTRRSRTTRRGANELDPGLGP